MKPERGDVDCGEYDPIIRADRPYRKGMAKRGYSREFRPHGETGKRYLLDEIPAGLWSAVKEKAKREGISIRALILSLLKEWVERK